MTLREPAKATRHGALTLIEVVVALALGLLLLVAVQGIVLSAYRAAAVLEDQSATAARRGLALQLLAGDLDSRPAGAGLTLRPGQLSFRTMNALQSARVAARHVVSVRYGVEPAATGQYRLVRAEREVGDDGGPDSGVVLTEAVCSVTIEVFDGQRWHAEWPLPTPRAARAVRLAIDWGPGQRDERIITLMPLEWRQHNE